MVIVAPLVALFTLAAFWFILGIAGVITIILLYIADVFEGLPWPVDKLSGPIKSLAQGITHVCGIAEDKMDGLIGGAWHLFARYLDQTWHHLVWSSHVLAQAAEAIAELAYEHLGIKRAVHSLTQTFRGIEHGVRTLEREFHGIEHMVKQLTRDITKGIGHDLRLQVKALEHDVTKIEHRVIPGIRSDVAHAEAEVTALQKWVTDHALLVGTTALTGAVAWALGQLGLGGLRCPSFLRLLGKHACGLGKLLDDLLGIAIAGLALEAVCDFLPLIEAAFGAIIGPMVHLLNEVPIGNCEKEPADWSLLSVRAGPLPPVQTLGTFPT